MNWWSSPNLPTSAYTYQAFRFRLNYKNKRRYLLWLDFYLLSVVNANSILCFFAKVINSGNWNWLDRLIVSFALVWTKNYEMRGMRGSLHLFVTLCQIICFFQNVNEALRAIASCIKNCRIALHSNKFSLKYRYQVFQKKL